MGRMGIMGLGCSIICSLASWARFSWSAFWLSMIFWAMICWMMCWMIGFGVESDCCGSACCGSTRIWTCPSTLLQSTESSFLTLQTYLLRNKHHLGPLVGFLISLLLQRLADGLKVLSDGDNSLHNWSGWLFHHWSHRWSELVYRGPHLFHHGWSHWWHWWSHRFHWMVRTDFDLRLSKFY